MAEYRQTIETPHGDRGVIHPGHPPIIESELIAEGKKYQAGTILVYAEGASIAATADDQPDCILVQDIDTTDGAAPALCLKHGTAVRARLICADPSDAPAGDILVGKLSARGIYPVQSFDYSVLA